MSDAIRHSRAVSPYFIPNKGGSPSNFHGLTNVGSGVTVDSEDVFVVGKKEKCGTDTQVPDATVPLTQLERGTIEAYLTLANLASEPVGGLSLEDFSNGLVDVVYYEKDRFSGDVELTTWIPKSAITAISLNIADPDAKIERTFELQGDDKKKLQYDGNHLIWAKFVTGTGDSGAYILDVSDPVPQDNPNISGQFILRVDETLEDGTHSTLVEGTDYTYNSGTQEITILSVAALATYNVYYGSDSFGGPGDPTTVDSGDPCFLKASYVTVLLSDGTTEVELDILTSLSIDATLNRLDEGVIGTDENIIKEISDTPVTVSLTGRIKQATLYDAFMGQIGNDWSLAEVSRFLSNVRVTVKIYDSADKTNFLIGYQVDNLSFSSDTEDYTANEFGTLDLSAASDNLKITTTEGDLA